MLSPVCEIHEHKLRPRVTEHGWVSQSGHICDSAPSPGLALPNWAFLATDCDEGKIVKIRKPDPRTWMNFPNPTPGSVGSHTGIAKGAKRPHAAALYLDFIMSAEGAAALAKAGGLPARKGAKAAWDEVSDLEEKGVRILMMGHEKMAQVKDKGYKLIEDIIIRKQIR